MKLNPNSLEKLKRLTEKYHLNDGGNCLQFVINNKTFKTLNYVDDLSELKIMNSYLKKKLEMLASMKAFIVNSSDSIQFLHDVNEIFYNTIQNQSKCLYPSTEVFDSIIENDPSVGEVCNMVLDIVSIINFGIHYGLHLIMEKIRSDPEIMINELKKHFNYNGKVEDVIELITDLQEAVYQHMLDLPQRPENEELRTMSEADLAYIKPMNRKVI
jgi:hypothetical protein